MHFLDAVAALSLWTKLCLMGLDTLNLSLKLVSRLFFFFFYYFGLVSNCTPALYDSMSHPTLSNIGRGRNN